MQIMNVVRGKFNYRRVGLLPCFVLLVTSLCVPAAEAETRLVVRDSLGLPGLNLSCLLAGCKVVTGLGDPDGQLFLVTFPDALDPITGLLRLSLSTGILSVEIDQQVNTQDAYADSTPTYLTDRALVNYYGTSVWHGYVTQPGN